jgi:hypothetical protein
MNNFRGQGAGRSKYVQFSPLQARILSLAALCGMSGWFLSGIWIPPNDPYFVRFFFQVLGSVSVMFLFLSNYGFVAFTRRQEIDERELQQRNIAFSHAYFCVLVLLYIGFGIGKDITRVPPEIFADFMAVALGACLILPPTLLAWRDDGG